MGAAAELSHVACRSETSSNSRVVESEGIIKANGLAGRCFLCRSRAIDSGLGVIKVVGFGGEGGFRDAGSEGRGEFLDDVSLEAAGGIEGGRREGSDEDSHEGHRERGRKAESHQEVR